MLGVNDKFYTEYEIQQFSMNARDVSRVLYGAIMNSI